MIALAGILLGVLLSLGVVLPLVLGGKEFSMKESQGLVFEIYRYGVCFVMLLSFALLSYFLLSGMLADPGNYRAVGGPALGILLTVVLFFTHWRMKNPAAKAD